MERESLTGLMDENTGDGTSRTKGMAWGLITGQMDESISGFGKMVLCMERGSSWKMESRFKANG